MTWPQVCNVVAPAQGDRHTAPALTDGEPTALGSVWSLEQSVRYLESDIALRSYITHGDAKGSPVRDDPG